VAHAQVPAVYSDRYAAEHSAGPLVFDQLPWFVVADRLRKENDGLLEQREEIRAQLLEQVGGGWAAAGSGWQVA
jgi:hypothetical protein